MDLVPLKNLKEMTRVSILGINLSEDQLRVLQDALPDLKILQCNWEQ